MTPQRRSFDEQVLAHRADGAEREDLMVEMTYEDLDAVWLTGNLLDFPSAVRDLTYQGVSVKLVEASKLLVKRRASREQDRKPAGSG